MRLPLDRPFDLAKTLESGQAFRWRRWGEWYEGVIYETLFLVRQDGLGLEFCSTPLPEEEAMPILWRYLGLEDDLSRIYQRIGVDNLLAQAIHNYYGMRITRQSPWECLVSFICSANSNIPRIGVMIAKLSETFGRPIEGREHLQYTFPTPEKIADAGEGSLRSLGLGFRAKYLARVASKVASGEIALETLRQMPYEEAKRELVSLPGVGEKVADCVLLFSLEKMEAFPIDRWVRRAIEEWYLDGRRASYRALGTWARDYFGAYAGYAQQYLFHRRRLEGNRSARKAGSS